MEKQYFVFIMIVVVDDGDDEKDWLNRTLALKQSAFFWPANNPYLSTHTVYQYKIQFLFCFWEGMAKLDTGKHNFHILMLF